MAAPWYLIGYDIADNRRRHQALRQLRSVSLSYQDSIFEVQAGPVQLNRLLRQLSACIDPASDSLICVPLGQSLQAWQLGSGPLSPLGELLLID